MNNTQKAVLPRIVDSGPAVYRGYTLITPVERKEIHLIDMKGRLVHTWELKSELGGHGELLPNGNLLFSAKDPEGPLTDLDGASGRLLEVDWEGNIVWQYEDSYFHNDFRRLPNGNTLILRWVSTPKDIAVKVKGGLPDTERERVMWSDSFREIDSDGETLWEWHGYEHLDTGNDIICPLCFRNEWTHANSFAVNTNGDILVSFMKTNNIAIIEKTTGNIVWRWGGFRTLAHPHDVCWVDNKKVMVFGCGGHMAGFEVGESEIICIDIKSKKIVWQFKELNARDFYTSCKGSCQLLPNGNILICEGDTGRIFEVSKQMKVVWEFLNQSYSPSVVFGKNNMLFGAYRYGPDYEGLKGNTRRSDDEIIPQAEITNTSGDEQALMERLSNLGY